MPINFPDAPTTGDTHTVGDKTWTFDGTAWTLVLTGPSTEHGALLGLGDDDHIQYLLADGTRTATELNVSGSAQTGNLTVEVDGDDPYVRVVKTGEGAASIKKATGYVSISALNAAESAYQDVVLAPDGGNVGIGTASPAVPLDVVGNVFIASASGDDYLDFDLEAEDTRFTARLSRSMAMDGQSVAIYAYDPVTDASLPISISGDPVSIYNLRGGGAVDFSLADSVDLSGGNVNYGDIAINDGDNQLLIGNDPPNENFGAITAWNTNTESAIDLTLSGANLLLYGTTVKINDVRVPVSDTIYEIVKLTQAAYDALTPDANTLYVIVG